MAKTSTPHLLYMQNSHFNQINEFNTRPKFGYLFLKYKKPYLPPILPTPILIINKCSLNESNIFVEHIFLLDYWIRKATTYTLLNNTDHNYLIFAHLSSNLLKCKLSGKLAIAKAERHVSKPAMMPCLITTDSSKGHRDQ